MKRPRFLLHAARIADEILFWPVLALVIWGELWWRGGGGHWNINDKLLHLLAYFVLGSMVAGGFKERRGVTLGILGLIAVGAVLEVAQSYVGRDTEFYDAVANAVGAVLGAVTARFIVEPLRKRFPYS